MKRDGSMAFCPRHGWRTFIDADPGCGCADGYTIEYGEGDITMGDAVVPLLTVNYDPPPVFVHPTTARLLRENFGVDAVGTVEHEAMLRPGVASGGERAPRPAFTTNRKQRRAAARGRG